MNQSFNVLLGSFVFMALSACSSGGGDDQPIVPMQTGPVAITSDSAPAISSAVVTATLDLQDFSGFVAPTTVATSAGQSKVSGLTFTKTELNETVSCSGGGSIMVTGQFDDPDTLSVGDVFTSSADNCSEFDSVINGSFEVTIDRLVGTADDILRDRYAMGATVITDNFSLTVSGETTTSNGDFRFDLDTTAFDVSLFEVSGNVFSIDGPSDTLTLSNFTIERTDEVASGVYTLKSSGTVDSASLQGSVTYSTVQTLIGFDDNYPYSGELLITGAGGATVRLIAVSSTDVRLEIDSNGDGAVNNIVDTTWADIIG